MNKSYKEQLLSARMAALSRFHDAVRLREAAERDLDAINSALGAIAKQEEEQQDSQK